ncbi:MAG: helix-turn-helix domain-containing protein, partial [Bacteroidia bacterium]
IPQKTLHEIVQTLPATRAELKSVKGMGGTRLQQFGKDILEQVIAYRKQKGLDLPIGAEKEAEKVGLSSPEISFEVFKSGKSIIEIASERGLAVSTIESHLAQFVGTGEIRLDQVVEPKKSRAILDYIEKHKTRGSNEIRAGLGSDYSYSEIRFVFKYLEASR